MWTDDFIESEKRRMQQTPIISFSNKDKWIIVMNTDENIKKFNRVMEKIHKKKDLKITKCITTIQKNMN